MRCIDFIIIVFITHIGLAQESENNIKCDPKLESRSKGFLHGYKKRGDRCEGIYGQEIDNRTLEIRSFTKGSLNYDLKSTKFLSLKWAKPPFGNELKIEGKSLLRKLYYKMDTQQSISSKVYTWPTNLLSRLNITESQVGWTAKTTSEVNGKFMDIYIPIMIDSNQNTVISEKYELVIFPGVELREVYISVVAIEFSSDFEKEIITNKKLERKKFFAKQVINIPITGIKESGLYRVDIDVAREFGGTSNKSIIFYNTID